MPGNDDEAVRSTEPRATVGARLTAAREAQELSLEQLAGELRIERQHLAALEADHFEAIGAPVFAKGYLKQYALRLDLDYGDLLAQYYRQVEPQEISIVPRRAVPVRRPVLTMPRTVAALLSAVAAVLLTVWWWNRPPAPQAVATPPPMEAPSAPVEDRSGSTFEARAEAVAEPLPPAAEERSLELAESFGAALPVAAPALRTVEVELEFAEACWTEITDRQGRRVFYGLAQAGSRSRFTAEPPLDFLLGNADGVRVLIDEAPYPVPSSRRSSGSVRFSVALPEP